jgi:LPS export ABC transporter permease LptG
MKYCLRIDRYVAGYFITSYGICFLFFLGLFVVIDLVPKVGDILEAAPRAAERGESLLWLTVWFYLMKIPAIFLMVAPYLTVMAAMFCISRLRKNNELVPMVMSGMSIFRILLPMFIVGSLLLAGMVLVQEYVAPACAEKRLLGEAFLIDHEDQLLIEQEVFWDRAGREIVVNNYNVATRVIGSTEIRFLQDERGGRKIEYRLKGVNLRWLGPDDSAWSREEGLQATEDFSNPGAEPEVTTIKRFTTDLKPSDIVMRIKDPGDLTFEDIRRAYAMNPQNISMKILLHFHITFPLSNLLLVLLGVPFVLRQESRSNFLGLTMALLICAGYFVLDVIMRDLGTKGQINPLLAAWSASIFCGAIGIYLFDSIKT